MDRWAGSTAIRAWGRQVVIAFRNAADGSIATIWIRSRHVWERAFSQPSTAMLSRPSTTPNTCPEFTLTRVVIHGSTRSHALVSRSRNQRTRR